MNSVILKQVDKTYRLGAVTVPALANINLEIRPNCFTVISGASGSGKTTLLNMIGCIDRPDAGEIILAGRAVNTMSDNELSDFRVRHLGFVFQSFNLMPVLTAYENVEYPLLLAKMLARERKQRVMSLLDAVGLADKAGNQPGQLSGGQRQRVAIARVMLKDAPILILDEATSALDSEVEQAIQENLFRLMQGKTVIAIAHRLSTIAALDRLIVLDKGKIIEDGSHGELIAKGGIYAGLWHRQSGGFLALEAAE